MLSKTTTSTTTPVSNPLIPEKYLDVPSQRLYYLSFGLLCQSIKILDFIWSVASGQDQMLTCRKWLLADFTYCVLLAQLRIPRLQYSKASVILQVISLWFLDGILFGGINVNAAALLGSGFTAGLPGIPGTNSFGIRSIMEPLTFGLISTDTKDKHLLGQHTVRMSPISTAHLNPENLNFCISPSNPSALLPVVLNNTNLVALRYSITPLGYSENGSNKKIKMVDMSSKDLKNAQNQILVTPQPTPSSLSDDEYDEYDDDEDDTNKPSALQLTQSMAYISMSQTGIIRLERVVDHSSGDARLIMSEAVVVPCPQVEFAEDSVKSILCSGQDPDTQLKIRVQGVPPMSVKWLRTIDQKSEQFLVEGIQGDQSHDSQHYVDMDSLQVAPSAFPITRIPGSQEVTVPLTISLEDPGTYLYALEEITDGVGNTVRVGNDAPVLDAGPVSKTKSARSFIVLRRPAVSFKYCSSDAPESLLINSTTKIELRSQHVNPFDMPVLVDLEYSPLVEGETKGKYNMIPEHMTVAIKGPGQPTYFLADAPGEYKIKGVKGEYCSGTVQAPDVCRIAQKPVPTAEIKWNSIHECSGDTGVSASIFLHGTPPFQIYYTMKRDNEHVQEISKMYNSLRSELTLQPERSGRYTFEFVALSDANYRRRPLSGPSINKVIHPVASAEFTQSHRSPTVNGKTIMSTCSGDTVDVTVDLRGTGPWNLEVQVIGPKKTETLPFLGIDSPKKNLTIPIPEELKKNSGTFEIGLVSVEDASHCKRPLSVAGRQVNVKRVVPTAQFYGNEQERKVIIAQNEKASLPLRLTGNGPWRVKYKRHKSNVTMAETFLDRNDNIQVMDDGLYEIVAVEDLECPGTVASDASTYVVEWIPKPSAKLSSSTQAAHDPIHGSYILPPICEGVNDHVDLELTGRPPFQIMYNIAQNSESGGTKLMGQPIFNSIQRRTRFQLTTTTPGRVYYEVKQIGDDTYPLAKSKDPIPPSERLLFEQQVSLRPSARFRNRNRLAYCLHDSLVPVDNGNPGDGVISFEGLPPFTVVLAIKNIAGSSVKMHTATIGTNHWRLDVPQYTFSSIGPHLISIESVSDVTGCPHAALDPAHRRIWADVAESAAIIPLERREHICVGDATVFQLEGTPPWTVGYTVNGKAYTQGARTSPFAVVQQQPGLFAVTSIAHQQKMCKAAVADLRFRVHRLPSAQVGHGRRIFQDIHEGDQAEILFTLIGEPPFTFTYQRTEISTTKGVMGRVLETHTVSHVQNHEYSIFSALEGTWTVTSISDRYCRYPPVQPDQAVEKSK